MLINKSKGLTHSERFLAKLAEKTFLYLWSYPNLYKKDKTGQELCDLLVVFNNHIIIFSDKSIRYENKNGIEKDWKRWAKKAILKSSNQIYGAERYIKEFSEEIYLDAKCDEKFPFKIPDKDEMNIHRIALASFSGEELKNHIGGTGAFIIDPSIIGDEHLDTPLTVGQINKDKGFIHIMNETSLEILLSELNTITDFTNYLFEKEKFITSGQLYKAYSEEDLLAVYLENIDDEEKHSFNFDIGNDKIEIEKNYWFTHQKNDRYYLKKIEENDSYIWDDMISRFTSNMLNQEFIDQSKSNPLELEIAFRIMASEDRLNRRVLSKSFLNLFEKFQQVAKEETILKRVAYLGENEFTAERAYVFLIANKPDYWDYETYRDNRRDKLLTYILALKNKYPNLLDIIGISRESLDRDFSSNDIVYVDGRDWTKEEHEEAEKIRLEGNYLKDGNVQKFETEEAEYPYIGS